MNKRPQLAVEKRQVLRKDVKKLRAQGVLPANIYGKNIPSLSVQVNETSFKELFSHVGETGLIDLLIDGQSRPVLIHDVQRDYLTQQPIHADFYQVNLTEKVRTMVPITVVGEPKAVADKLGMLIQPLSELEVEALPESLPEHLELDVTPLASVDEQFLVSDIKLPEGVVALSDGEQVVVKITELVSKEAAEQAAAEEAAKEAAKAAEETQTEGTSEQPTTETEPAPFEKEPKTTQGEEK